MTPANRLARLSRQEMEAILAVTRALAAPFDLPALLVEVTAAARRVLHAERGSVWLLDEATGELVLECRPTSGRCASRSATAWWAPALATAGSSTCPTVMPTRASMHRSTALQAFTQAAA